MKEEDYIKINKKAYDIVAKEYKEKYKNNEGAKLFYDLIKDWILESRKKDNEKVLEIGGGTGALLSILENNGYQTVDVELSTEMSSIAQNTSPNTIIINDNILNVNFLPASFDYVLALAVLHNFPKKDLKKLLIKIKQWLKDDGFFIIDTTANNVSEEGYYEKEDYQTKVIRYRKKFTKKEIEDLLIESGFVIDKCKDYVDSSSGKNWLEYKLKKSHKKSLNN